MGDGWPSITYMTTEALLVVDHLDRCQDPLLLAEVELANNVSHARLRELMGGRSIARRAFQLFGLAPMPILATTEGAPVWPHDLCGSISHSNRHVAVLIARSSRYKSVGIDVDDKRPLGEAAKASVVTERELQAIDRAGLTASGITAENIAFSAKEAVFKCQYPITLDASLDYLDVCLKPGKSPLSLGIQLVNPDRSPLKRIENLINIQIVNASGVMIVCALMERAHQSSQIYV